MKIALFTDTLYDANGVSRFLQDMAHCAHMHDRSFAIFSSTLKAPKGASISYCNASPKIRIPMPFYPQLDLTLPSSGALKEAFDRFKPDIVHVSTPGPVGLYGKWLAKKARLPLVGTYHTDFPRYLYDNLPLRSIEQATSFVMRRFYRDFSGVLIRSEHYRTHLEQKIGVANERIHLLRAGTNTRRFHPRFKHARCWADFGINAEGFKLLYVGRLSIEKRVDFLLDVWRDFKKRVDKDVDFILVGNGRYEKVLQKEPGIHLLGHQSGESLSFLYAASDLFVSASESETLGQTILEAMASGTPVVVSGQGGHLTFVTPSCGAIVYSQEKSAWVAQLDRLYRNASLRKEASIEALRIGQSMDIGRSFEEFWQMHHAVWQKTLPKAPPSS